MSELERRDARALEDGADREGRHWKNGVARDDAADVAPERVVLDMPAPIEEEARQLARTIDGGASVAFLVIVVGGLVAGAIAVIVSLAGAGARARGGSGAGPDVVLYAAIGLVSLVVLVLHLAWPKARSADEPASRVPLVLRGGAATVIAGTALLLAALGLALAWQTLAPVRAGGELDMGAMLLLLASFGPILFGAVGLVMLPSFLALWSARGEEPSSPGSPGSGDPFGPAGVPAPIRPWSPPTAGARAEIPPPEAIHPNPHALASAAS